MASAPIVVQRKIKATPRIVWNAITDASELRQWLFETIREFKPQIGFETEFDVQFEDQCFRHQWKVTEVVPDRRMVIDWRYAGVAGESTVTWELVGTSEHTNLKVEHRGVDSFPQDNPAFSTRSCEAGWNFLLNERLPAFLISAQG